MTLPGMFTVPETNKSHLKTCGGKIAFLLGWLTFRGKLAVSFRECEYTISAFKVRYKSQRMGRYEDYLPTIYPGTIPKGNSSSPDHHVQVLRYFLLGCTPVPNKTTKTDDNDNNIK